MIGERHRGWLAETCKGQRLIREPMPAPNGSILREPLFWYKSPLGRFACLPPEKPSSRRIRDALEDAGVSVLEPVTSES